MAAPPSTARSLVAIAAATFLALLVGCFSYVEPAEATSYRYWTYWTGGSGQWSFSSQGAARRPPDGSVDGWRFAVSEEAGSSATPGLTSSFRTICASTAAQPNMKRVGIVVDFGTASDAPPGDQPPSATVARCVVVPTSANGYDVLAAVASLRTESGLICAIAGYPSVGCGEAVNQEPSPGSGNDSSGGQDQGQKSHPEGDGSDQQSGGDGARPGSTTGQTSSTGGPSAGRNTDQPVGNNATSPKPSRSEKSKLSDEPPVDPSQEPGNSDDDRAAFAVAVDTELPESATGSPLGLLAGVLLLVGVASAAWWLRRRQQ